MQEYLKVLILTESESNFIRIIDALEKTGYHTAAVRKKASEVIMMPPSPGAFDLIVIDICGLLNDEHEMRRLVNSFLNDYPLVIITDRVQVKYYPNCIDSMVLDCLPAEDIAFLGKLVKHLLREFHLNKELTQLEGENERLTATLASIGDGVITADINGNVTFMNQTAEELTGWSRDEAEGRHIDVIFKIVDKDKGTVMESPFSRTLRKGSKSGLKRSTALVSKSNAEYYISASSSPVRDNKGGIDGFIIVFRDITKIKEIEKELEKNLYEYRKLEENLVKSRDFYLTLFENFPAMIWRADVNKMCNYFNKGWLDFTGRTVDEEMGDGWMEGVHSDDIGMCARIYFEAFNERRPFQMEYRLRHKDGEFRWIHDIGRPFYDIGGEFFGYIGVCFDITERRMGEEGLKRYQLLSENANDIILFADTDGYVIEANDAGIRAFGYEKEDMLNKSIFYLVNPDPRSPVGAMPYQANAKGIYYEATAYRKDGSTFTAEVSMQGTEIGDSKVFMAILRDVSEKKRFNEELKQAKDSAETANQAKSAFLANMSHEIRTPLNGMMGMIDLTLLTDLTAEQKDNLHTAKQCAGTLLNLINDILDFSKIEAGKLTLEHIDFDFLELIEQTIKPHTIKAQEKGLVLQTQIYPGIPRTVNGDPYRLKQVLNNLTGNAVKFTERGMVSLYVNLTSQTDDYLELEFQVQDTGIGIGPEDMERLFNTFSQVDASHTRRYGGTGLGLAISRQLVERMDGSIWVESVKGKGSVFHFTIKLGVGSRVVDTSVKVLPVNKTQGPLTILLAEDDKINQLVITRMIEETGHRVITANNGREALEVLDSEAVDVILMDIQMPEMDGIEATRRIRNKEKTVKKHVPVIALTAYALHGDREKFLSVGMDGYISKPIQMKNFLDTVEEVTTGLKNIKQAEAGPISIDYDGTGQFIAGEMISKYKSRHESLLKNIDVYSEQLKYYFEQRDLPSVEKSAYEVKKLSSELSMPYVRSMAFKMELAARRGDLEEAEKYFGLLLDGLMSIKENEA